MTGIASKNAVDDMSEIRDAIPKRQPKEKSIQAEKQPMKKHRKRKL